MHVQSNDHWETHIYDIKVGDKDIPFAELDKYIILDTGASNNYFPTT